MTEEARDLLLANGGTLHDEDTVRIPGRLVEEALEAAPGHFTLYDRNGEPAIVTGSGRTAVGAGVTNLNYLDPRDGTVKDFSLGFTAEATKLADALTDIDFVATPGVTRPLPDLPLEIVNQCEFREMVTNTTKPLMVLIAGEPELRDIYDMAELIAGGADELRAKPFVIPYLNSVSPLLFNLETLEKLFLSADRGLPVCPQAAPQVGATGPSSIAGTCVDQRRGDADDARDRAAAEPRHPVHERHRAVPDGHAQRRGHGRRARRRAVHDADEPALPAVGAADARAVGRRGLEGRRRADRDGADLLHARHGARGDRHGLRRRLRRDRSAVQPRDPRDERRGRRDVAPSGRAAVDSTTRRSPSRPSSTWAQGRVFLGEPHTLEHFRELWLPKMFSWDGRREWEEAGSKTMRERCRDEVFRIWETHEVPPLPADVLAGMQEIIEKRRATIPAD